MAEEALVQGLCVRALTGQPGRDRGLSITEDPPSLGKVQSFSKGREYHGDLVGRGFQTIQGGVATSGEGGAAGRASKRLDALGMSMLAIADDGVDLSIGDPGVGALWVGTGKALGLHSLGCASAAFDLAPGTHRWCRCESHTRRVVTGEATGGAIKRGAWLEQTLH